MPCGITGLCGISSRFRLLSPCTGQVTHALLTRPPLSNMVRHPERIRSVLFVRLACVRHAASVHPEPGSNSHIMVFSWTEFIFCRSPCAGIISLRFFWFPLESCEVFQFESYDSLGCPLKFHSYSHEFSGLSDYPISKVLCLLPACLLLSRASAKFILPNILTIVNTFFNFF